MEVGHKTGTAAGKEKKWKRREALSLFGVQQRFMWPRACEGALRLFSRHVHCGRGAASIAPDKAQLAATEPPKERESCHSNDAKLTTHDRSCATADPTIRAAAPTTLIITVLGDIASTLTRALGPLGASVGCSCVALTSWSSISLSISDLVPALTLWIIRAFFPWRGSSVLESEPGETSVCKFGEGNFLNLHALYAQGGGHAHNTPRTRALLRSRCWFKGDTSGGCKTIAS